MLNPEDMGIFNLQKIKKQMKKIKKLKTEPVNPCTEVIINNVDNGDSIVETVQPNNTKGYAETFLEGESKTPLRKDRWEPRFSGEKEKKAQIRADHQTILKSAMYWGGEEQLDKPASIRKPSGFSYQDYSKIMGDYMRKGSLGSLGSMPVSGNPFADLTEPMPEADVAYVPQKVIPLSEYEELVANQKPDDWREDTVLVNIENLADQFTEYILKVNGRDLSEDERVDLRDEMYDLIFKNKV